MLSLQSAGYLVEQANDDADTAKILLVQHWMWQESSQSPLLPMTQTFLSY